MFVSSNKTEAKADNREAFYELFFFTENILFCLFLLRGDERGKLYQYEQTTLKQMCMSVCGVKVRISIQNDLKDCSKCFSSRKSIEKGLYGVDRLSNGFS